MVSEHKLGQYQRCENKDVRRLNKVRENSLPLKQLKLLEKDLLKKPGSIELTE